MDAGIEDEIIKVIRDATQETARTEWSSAQTDSIPPLYDYRFDHVREVVRISRSIAEAEGADKFIVTMGAWLHDVAKPGLGGKNKHGVEGAKMARAILESKGMAHDLIDRICEVIEMHVGLTLKQPLQPIEAQIVWEADKLVKLGVTGFIHYLINGLKIRPGRNLRAFAKDLHEFIPLATQIANSMHTELARKMARERLQILKDISENLQRELIWNGD